MNLHVSSVYAASGINAVVNGEEIALFNLALGISAGDAVTVEADETPSDNTANLRTSDVEGAVSTLVATATNEDGTRQFAASEEITLVAEEVEIGTFTLTFVELV